MRERTVSGTTLTAVMVATVAALIGRSWLELQLRDRGIPVETAADLSYLVVPFVLALLLFPLWRDQKPFLASQLSLKSLTWQLVMRAIAIGLLLRLVAWGQLIAGASFGFYQSDNPNAIVGPYFSFECAAPGNVILGFVVMAVMVPLIEEATYRGYVMSTLRRRGVAISVIVSALTFMIFHSVGTWWFALGGGVVFGVQYWKTLSLWSSTISHAVFNCLIQIDWRCLTTQWNPLPADLPLVVPGIAAIAITLTCIIAITLLLAHGNHGAAMPRGAIKLK